MDIIKENNSLTDNMVQRRRIVEIFWTGGFDSTFRIVQLSRCDVVIQPYYISDNRESESNELDAIRSITKILITHKGTRCIFRELIIVNMKDRTQNSSITEAYTHLRKTDFFGSQYEWLACFSLYHPGIELSIHEDDKALLLINKYGSLLTCDDPDIGKYQVIDKKKSDHNIITLFKNYHLPLASWTKLNMQKFYVEEGYKDVMDLTWFCYSPKKGKPCGMCNPCIYTIEEGLTDRFTKSALLRYRIKKMYIRFKELYYRTFHSSQEPQY